MNILIIIAVLVLILAAGHAVRSKKRKERNKQTESLPAAIQDLPIGRWAYIDECSAHLVGELRTESNGGPDLLFSLAYEISRRGTRPAFIGVTHDPKRTDKAPTVKIMDALAINVPVYQGGHSYKPESSELGRAIIAETVKGEFDIVLGSPAGDLEWAFRNGAHVHNVTCYALLRGTWNETGDGGMPHRQTSAMKKSANYVAQRLGDRLIEVSNDELYQLLRIENFPDEFKDINAFINRNRDLEAWNIAFSDSVMTRNRQLNSNLTTGALRVADCLAVVRMHGDDITDVYAILSRVQHGLDIFKDRIKHGAKNTIAQTPATPDTPIPDTTVDISTFNQSRVKLYRGHLNPFSYKETSTITRARITSLRYWLDHTKDGIWKGKLYNGKHLIDGCDGIIAFNRFDNTWYVFMFEYSVRGLVQHHKGWSEFDFVKRGDPIGLITTTNILEPKWNIAGQAKERSAVKWVKAE